MRRTRLLTLVTLALSLAMRDAEAQPTFAPPPPPRTLPRRPPPDTLPPSVSRALEPTTDLRAHFGADLATRLVHSSDADQRLRGLERAAATGTSEGINLLVRALDASGAARSDSRALLAVARGLSSYASDSDARVALESIVSSPPGAPRPSARGGEAPTEDPDHAARVDLARATAALALAGSSDSRANEAALTLARGGGSGQRFAAAAVAVFPPSAPGALGPAAALNPTSIRLAASLGDLRMLDPLRTAARATDTQVREAALLALASFGDTRAIDAARAAVGDPEPSVRVAAATALLAFGAPERLHVVAGLLADGATAAAGARLAEEEQDAGIVRALAARIAASADPAEREPAIAALGHSALALAVEALAVFARNPGLAVEAADALARSPSGLAMGELIKLMTAPETRRLGARAYLVRAVTRGERDGAADAMLDAMARAPDARDRSLGLGGLVALGRRGVGEALRDPDPRVRRAVAGAALAVMSDDVRDALLERAAGETDPLTRQVLGVGLVRGDPNGKVTTLTLVDRVESATVDAPLATLELARRARAKDAPRIEQWLGSRDPLLRAHTARGLGASRMEDSAGRLAALYAYEVHAAVRRAAVAALAERPKEDGPVRKETLLLAARLDPDPIVRSVARRALTGAPFRQEGPTVRALAWLHLSTSAGSAPGGSILASVVRSDGLAIPIAFDDDGQALVPLPAGEARLVLAPRLPPYNAGRP